MYIKLWAMLFCFCETTVANDPSKETFVASHFVDVVYHLKLLLVARNWEQLDVSWLKLIQFDGSSTRDGLPYPVEELTFSITTYFGCTMHGDFGACVVFEHVSFGDGGYLLQVGKC